MKCVKCGFEKDVDGVDVCEKCGAVQSKSIKYYEGKKVEAGEQTDKILMDLKKLNDDISLLEKNIREDNEYDQQSKDELFKSILDLRPVIEKTSNGLINLKKHVLSFAVDFEINGKLKKAQEYIVSFENDYLDLQKKYTGLSTRPAKQGVAMSNNTNGDDFTRPEISPSDYQKIQDIEFSLSITKYPALDGLAGMYKVLAYIVMGFSLLAALSIFIVKTPVVGTFGVGMGSKIVACLLTLLTGGLIGLTLMAISESIKVLVDLECNSRAIREYTKALVLGKG